MFRRPRLFESSSSPETGPFHVVMSDMAPQTTGTKFTDQARSLELCLSACRRRKVSGEGRQFCGQDFHGADVGGCSKVCASVRPRDQFKTSRVPWKAKKRFFAGWASGRRTAPGLTVHVVRRPLPCLKVWGGRTPIEMHQPENIAPALFETFRRIQCLDTANGPTSSTVKVARMPSEVSEFTKGSQRKSSSQPRTAAILPVIPACVRPLLLPSRSTPGG